MLENQFIRLAFAGNAPKAEGDFSTQYITTDAIHFTRLCDVLANRKYIVTADAHSSTADVLDGWAMDSCIIAATTTPWYDTLPDSGVVGIYNWDEIIEMSTNATLYIAWGVKNYVDYLVRGGQFVEANKTFQMNATTVKVNIYPIAPPTPAPTGKSAFPIVLGTACGIFLPKAPQRVGVLDMGGDVISEETVSSPDKFIELFGEPVISDTSYLEWAAADINIGERFFLRVIYTDGTMDYSQPLVRVADNELSRVVYYCNEDAFGFPFHTEDDKAVFIHLPIRLYNPQLTQDSKTYVKADGNVMTLYAQYFKEWEGETDYLSEAMHDKIMAVLSCDYITISGKRVTKTDNYQIDWENYDLDCDGVTKLARATFKVRENITQRNSNY